MSKIYINEFNQLIKGDRYSEFLDIIAKYCDSFSLCSYFGRQRWSAQDLDILKNIYNSECDLSLKRIYRFIIARHSEDGNCRDINYLLQIPEYSILKENLKSVRVCNLSGIHCYTQYIFELNSDTLCWLKKLPNIFSVKKTAARMGIDPNKDILNSDSNEYELDDLSFCHNGDNVLYTSTEECVTINDTFLETTVDTFIHGIISDNISEFNCFRADFENIKKNITRDASVNDLSKKYDPVMFVPLLAVQKLTTCTKADNEIEQFYYDRLNTELLAEIFVKSIADHNDNYNLCFSWLHEQTPRKYSRFSRPLSGEKLIIDYLKSIPREKLSEACYNEINKALLKTHDIYLIDKLIRICIEKTVNIKSFSPIIGDLFKAWDETLPNNDDVIRNHIKQFLLQRIYGNRLKRHNGASARRMSAKKAINQYFLDDNIPDFIKCRIAYYYFFGFGIKKDYAMAVQWFKKAADKFVDCQYDLAKCYLNGWGTEKDIEQAKYWFTVAAENGHPKAREQLDRIIEKPFGDTIK